MKNLWHILCSNRSIVLLIKTVLLRYVTKIYAFGICYQFLEGVIKYRWNALPVEQRDGMKNYISEVIVQVYKLLKALGSPLD